MPMTPEYITVSFELERSGLIWQPEIGDEVVERGDRSRVSILVSPQGLSPKELREQFIWLPTVEQLVEQFEARQAMIYHAGLGEGMRYETVINTGFAIIRSRAGDLRLAFGRALKDLISNDALDVLH